MKITGKAWKFGDDVNTDDIISARYLNTTDEKALGEHCMEVLDPDFSKKVAKGDVMVAGKNFGCGSSREHAPIAIAACGIGCVIASSFARIFYRNSFNMGLLILESDEASAKINQGDSLEIDAGAGVIKNLTRSEEYRARPVPPFMQELVSAGGLLQSIKKRGLV
jgi:3-isopropylmalate dehydrogenase/3-isopropylmalate/(R)-2-methylmalate dehydratase small subunit